MRKSILLAVALIMALGIIAMPVFSTGDGKQAEKKETFSGTPEQLTLNVQMKDGKAELSWTKCNSKALSGYKVVHSNTNSNPLYPKDKYISWITDLNVTSFTHEKVDPSKDNYYRICALPNGFEYAQLNYCGLSNVVKVSGSVVSDEGHKAVEKPAKKEESKKEAPKKENKNINKVEEKKGEDGKKESAGFCTGCGTPCKAGDNFCGKCGKKLK